MSPEQVVRRYRRFLLVTSALIFGGTAVELWLVEHYQDLIQLLPFVFCGLGVASTLAVLWSARRSTLLLIRGVAGLVVAGSLFGIYEHVAHNWGFAAEINASASSSELFWDAVGGANPLLAPGALILAAVLAAAATYAHPALKK